MRLVKTKKYQEAVLLNTYNEFVEYLNGNISSLAIDIDDAISALNVYEKYVFDINISEK